MRWYRKGREIQNHEDTWMELILLTIGGNMLKASISLNSYSRIVRWDNWNTLAWVYELILLMSDFNAFHTGSQ